MKKLYLVLTAILILSFCSCSVPHLKLYDDDKTLADKRAEQVIDAIKKHNSLSLKKIFSKKALNSADDIDKKINSLFRFIKGHIKKIELDVGPQTDEEIKMGNRKKELKTWYYVYTNKEKYVLFLLDYPIDEFDANNIGLYSLRLVEAKDEDSMPYWQKMKNPGIYIGK